MRIGIDARLVHYRQAGIGQYILRLAEALAEMDQENEFILLQSRKDKQAIVDQPNFKRASLWTPSHHRRESAALLAELEQQGRLPGRYLILEVSPDLRQRQLQTLQQQVPQLLP